MWVGLVTARVTELWIPPRILLVSAPGTLTNDETYALVAYLLAQNEIIDRNAVLDSATLAAVKMPARDRFVTDDRKGGATFK